MEYIPRCLDSKQVRFLSFFKASDIYSIYYSHQNWKCQRSQTGQYALRKTFFYQSVVPKPLKI